MKKICFVLGLFFALQNYAQEIKKDSIPYSENDSIVFSYEMEEIVITNVKSKLTEEDKKKLLLLKRRVLKVYPFAKTGSERLVLLNQNMAKLKTNKEKKKYAKIVQKYLEEEFEGQLKNLSRKEGQILVKLIYRQTGQSTFDIIKEQKSGWKAFWSNRIAKVFNINIKEKYDPFNVPEDFYIEGYLLEAFNNRRLIEQAPAFPIDYDEIAQKWKK